MIQDLQAYWIFLNAYDLETFINNAKKSWDNIENPNREKLEVMKQELIKRCEAFIQDMSQTKILEGY